jgi:hypothetical protein
MNSLWGYVMNKRYVLTIGGPAWIETFHVIGVKVEMQKEEKALTPCGMVYTGASAPPERNVIPAL